ncbi:MAG: methionyl-tRNA formyltransferase [Rickettsiales bacterium]|nr:methionyl-tRNA formyltransferase [Rickettsiales bacterium]
MRIVFMGTPAFAVPTLQALYEAGHEIVAVYSQPPRPSGRGQKETPSPVHRYANEHNIPVLNPISLKTPEAQAAFAAHKAEVAVVVAYGLLLPKPILDAFPRGCINVHPSLLPRWRGAAPLQRTIMAGDSKTAIVIMQMDEGLDTGPMLLSAPLDIPAGMTAGQLHDLVADKAGALVLKVLADNPTPVAQPVDGVLYAKKISKDECRIDWNRPARDIYYHILGLCPAPGAFFEHKGEKIKIFDASYDTKATAAEPGTILDDQLTFACSDGTLRPKLLQRPGKKPLPLSEFLHGFSL